MSSQPACNATDAAVLYSALRRMALLEADETPVITPLTGGVSSLIARVDTRAGPLCVKQALPQLRVAAHWEAPVERNAAETAWLRLAQRVMPDAVPRLCGEDPASNTFAMEYLDPNVYRNWKTALRAGEVDTAFAGALGDRLGCLHAATATNAGLAAQFANDANFESLRLEPYLLETARNEPDVAPRLQALRAQTARTKLALVHGDVSPKNILIGPSGPVILDAECAWYGDPAFDLAFCLNHLLLKSAWRPQVCDLLMASFTTFCESYRAHIDWESPAAFEARAAALLPALLLARLRGKSPVEYRDELDRAEQVKSFAKRFLHQPAANLEFIKTAWLVERNA